MTSSENPDAGKHSTGSAWAEDSHDDGPADSGPHSAVSAGESGASVVSLRPLSAAPAPPPPPRRPAAARAGHWEEPARLGGGEDRSGAEGLAATHRPVVPVSDGDDSEHTMVVNPATRSAMSPSQWVRDGAASQPHPAELNPLRSRGEEDTAILPDEVRPDQRRREGPPRHDYEGGYGRGAPRESEHRRGREDYRGPEMYRDQHSRYSAPPAAATGGLGDGLASEFRQEHFATEVQPEPRRGWRRAVLKSSFGLINPGESRIEREDRERVEQIRANIRGQFVFAVFGPRGGVGKTATTAALGSMFASLRGSEVLALDGDPDSGNLSGRINDQTSATFRDILRERGSIRGVTDVRAYTAHNADKLDVLASSKDSVSPERYNPATLNETVDALRGSYRVLGIDCGKRMHDPLTDAVLDMVSALVVVTSSQYDAAKTAMTFHDYLRNTGRSQLLERSFLIISDRNPVGSETRAARGLIEDHVRNVIWKDPIYVPYDPHLHEGTAINLAQLKRPAYRAYLEATARLSGWYGMPPVPRGRR